MRYFDRVCVISLDRRSDRLAEFNARVPSDFPFGEIEFFKAIDGKKVKHPQWWRQGGGAWGCYSSHLRIIEESLNRGHDRVLIFEDDATFCDGFAEKATEYLAALPTGWIQAYFGGQHLKRPVSIPGNEIVIQAQNINRTHAYAIGGRAGLLALYRHLTDTRDWRNGHHIDHHYGRLHRASVKGFYAPSEWLCGQADGTSDVCGKPLAERWWARTRSPAQPSPARSSGIFVPVIGLHRSGSSATAMMLHKLGVSMGDRLGGYESRNGGGGEAVGVSAICERACRFPATKIKDYERLARELTAWIHRRRQRSGGKPVGAKYPHLCAFGSILRNACGSDLRVVHCDRPLEDSIDSLKRRSRQCTGWLAVSDQDAEAVQRWLWGEKNRFLSSLPADIVLTVRHDDIMSRPDRVAEEMISFLGVSPTKEQVHAAVSHIIKTEAVA